MRHGTGKYVFLNGDFYSGQYCQNKYHGEGTLNLKGVGVYTGDWADGLKHGFGRMVYSSGNIYEG